MSDELHNLLRAFRFSVDIDGEMIGFKSIRGIKLAVAYEPLHVGGMNDGPMLLPVPIRENGRLTLERGKYAGAPKKLPRPGAPVGDMSVSIYDENDSCVTEYTLESPIIESIELSALDALSSEVALETLTVGFRHLREK